MTTSISGAAGCSAAMSSARSTGPDPAKLQQQLLSKVDTNGDKSIDKSELKSFMDFVSSQTATPATDSDALFTTLDSDSDGAISATELADNGQQLFDQLRDQLMSSQLRSDAPPPPPPQGSNSDLFASIDANSDGSLDKTELTSFLADRADSSDDSSSTGNAPSIDDILARDDSDGDGSITATEFDAVMSKHGHGGSHGQVNRMIASLLDQYASAASSAVAATSETSFAAVA
jgi:Ca2+-binding EF-hand superfamily protein